MTAGQLVLVTGACLEYSYGTIIQVLSGYSGDPAYIVLVGSELLILTDADISPT